MPDLSAHANNMERWPELCGDDDWRLDLGTELEVSNWNRGYMHRDNVWGIEEAPDEAADALLGRYVKLLGKHHRFLLPPASDSYWAISKWPLVVEHTHADPLEACRLAVEAMEVTDE
jgi:hypothetical protein